MEVVVLRSWLRKKENGNEGLTSRTEPVEGTVSGIYKDGLIKKDFVSRR